MFNAISPIVSPVIALPPLPDLRLHSMQITGERSKVTGWAVRAQAGTLLQPGINYPGCREDTVLIFTWEL